MSRSLDFGPPPAFAAEFPNDNPALHEGAIWVCLNVCGPVRPVVRARPASAAAQSFLEYLTRAGSVTNATAASEPVAPSAVGADDSAPSDGVVVPSDGVVVPSDGVVVASGGSVAEGGFDAVAVDGFDAVDERAFEADDATVFTVPESPSEAPFECSFVACDDEVASTISATQIVESDGDVSEDGIPASADASGAIPSQMPEEAPRPSEVRASPPPADGAASASHSWGEFELEGLYADALSPRPAAISGFEEAPIVFLEATFESDDVADSETAAYAGFETRFEDNREADPSDSDEATFATGDEPRREGAGELRGSGANEPNVEAADADPRVAAVPDAFSMFVSALVDVALSAGATRAAAALPTLLDGSSVDFSSFTPDVQSRLLAGRVAKRSGTGLTASPEFLTTARTWYAVLRGEDADLSQCGSTTLDAFGTDLLRALGVGEGGFDVRRELRRRGVAAFGMLLAA